MESYWPLLVKSPSGNKPDDDFAVAIDNISKIVFSHSMKNVDWKNAKLAQRDVKEEVLALRHQTGKDILVGSPGLIVAITQLGLIDEYQLCVHPVIAGKGLPLFKTINEKIILKLLKTKSFNSGVIGLYYKPTVMPNVY
jgi:dihydrofolate reductase